MPPLGAPKDPAKPSRRSLRPTSGWVVLFLVLLALNIFFSTRAMQAAPRVRVPYTPFFLKQVEADHVASITSKGTAVQGTFTQPESYAGSKPTEKFSTEIPTFANTDRLSN